MADQEPTSGNVAELRAYRKTLLQGARECRTMTAQIDETRSSSDSLILRGHASVFETGYDIYGGPEKGGWTEHVDQRAFSKTLSESPDVHLLINHGGMPLARTKSGTLRLSTDERGLYCEAELDMSDPDVQRLRSKMTRGDMDQMSFAFRTIRDAWDEESGFGDGHRALKEVSLDHGDVSVVNFGANPSTQASLTAERALRYLTDAPEAELRGMTDADIHAAMRVLRSVVDPPTPKKPMFMTLGEARRYIED